jgi:hypothetical protein
VRTRLAFVAVLIAWGGTDPPAVVYIYAPDRKAERPLAHLAGFLGVLQVDGYGGYRVLAERNAVALRLQPMRSSARSLAYPIVCCGVAHSAKFDCSRPCSFWRSGLIRPRR